jgi:hypothetical protein
MRLPADSDDSFKKFRAIADGNDRTSTVSVSHSINEEWQLTMNFLYGKELNWTANDCAAGNSGLSVHWRANRDDHECHLGVCRQIHEIDGAATV